jgi:hypothetical protein
MMLVVYVGIGVSELTFNGTLLTKHVCLPNSTARSHSPSKSHISPIITPHPPSNH